MEQNSNSKISANGQPAVQPKSRAGQIVVKFEFITLKKVLKMSMNSRSSIKSLKPLFAAKLDY